MQRSGAELVERIRIRACVDQAGPEPFEDLYQPVGAEVGFAAATTNPGRWGFGILVGLLAVVVRVTNASLFQGALFSLLLASIFSPLFDYYVVERNIRRRAMRGGAGA